MERLMTSRSSLHNSVLIRKILIWAKICSQVSLPPPSTHHRPFLPSPMYAFLHHSPSPSYSCDSLKKKIQNLFSDSFQICKSDHTIFLLMSIVRIQTGDYGFILQLLVFPRQFLHNGLGISGAHKELTLLSESYWLMLT